MKILLISTRYTRGGGADRCAVDLLDRLPQVGATADIFVSDRNAGDPPNVHGLRLPLERYLRICEMVTGRLADWRHPGSRLALGKISLSRYDVVHLHNMHGGWISRNAVHQLCRRMPVVWTLHDEWAATGGLPYDLSRVMSPAEIDARLGAGRLLHPHDPAAPAVTRFLRRWMPRPAAMISPSRYITDLTRASGRFDAIPIHQIPYGVELLERPEIDTSRAAARLLLKIPADARVILLIAFQLDSPYKGIWLALDALAKLRGLADTRPTHVLLLGNCTDDLVRRIPFPVTAPGFVSDPGMLTSAYRAADVTLVPSVADNYPYVALESLACGTPLVAFRVGGMPEIIGEGERGLLAEPFDTDQMARHLHRSLCDEAFRLRAGGAGSRWVRDVCSPGTFVAANLRVYEEAIASFAPRSSVLNIARR